jgi:putative FmdB family regulatory protein
MPTYDYECKVCGHKFEKFQSITARPVRKCPACGKYRVRRLIGNGAGILFRGSGFYQTDYRSESYRKGAEKENPPKTSDSGEGEGGNSSQAGKGGETDSPSSPQSAEKS